MGLLLQWLGVTVPERRELRMGLDAPARARRWIVGFCESCDLGHLGDEAALLVDELVTNAVLHARTDCVVVAEKDDDVLRVEVIDSAGDFADVQPGAERLSAESGRGLVIVDALATTWGVEEHPEGKSVWFTLAAEVPSRHAAPTATPSFRVVRS